MARGRRPEPAAIKAAKGNPGRRRLAPDVQSEVDPGGVKAPATLTKDQRDIWLRLAPELERMRLLHRADATAFHRYCVALAQYMAAERKLRRTAIVKVVKSAHNPDGLERVSGHFKVMLLLDKRLTDLEDRFGMNPAARQAIFARYAALGAQPSLPLGDAATGDDKPAAEPAPALPLTGFLNQASAVRH